MTWHAIKEWFERVIYCHHNARVLADTEWRLSCVLDAATGGKLSKPSYDWPTMSSWIDDHHSVLYRGGWDDAVEQAEGDKS